MIAPPRYSDHGEHLAAIRAAALRAADPHRAVRAFLRLSGSTLHAGKSAYQLKANSRVLLVGAGKAGVAMARAVADVLGQRLTAGVVAVPDAPADPIPGIRLVRAGHPILNEGSLEAGRMIHDLLAAARLQADDLVIAVLSGGGSALLELPRPGVTLAGLQTMNDLLIRSGATVQEINVVRQALSLIKGGGLARMAQPAQVMGLILSDIVGDPLHLVASGPTVLLSSPSGPLAIVERYQLTDRLPFSVLDCLRASQPVIGDRRTAVSNRLVGGNSLAVQAAADASRALGFVAMPYPEALVGEARLAGALVGETLKRRKEPAQVPACLLFGGETTVTVKGKGKGGRNQEVALSAALILSGVEGVALMAFGTDGVDGPTDAAGAIVTGETIAQGDRLGLSAQAALAENDSYPYLKAVGALVVTGPTGTNVSDLTIGLIY